MADRAITDLNVVPASIDDNNTWFVTAQNGTAYKVSGHEFVLALGTILDGHGGVQSISYTPPVAPSLTGTLTITLADNSTTTLSITNGKGISNIVDYWAVSSSNSTTPSSWQTTMQTMTSTDRYLWHYQTVTYNDNTTTDTIKCVVGVFGDTGDPWYMWIRYAAVNPTSDSDIGTTPDDWIGIYSGTEDDPDNLHYTDFDWYQYKGATGNTGAAATISSTSIGYQQSDSGSVVPEGSWTALVPAPAQGKYLWTRTSIEFNTGSPIVFYSVSRYGIDGSGAVSTVNSVSPDGNGNVAITGDDIPTEIDNRSVDAHLAEIETFTAANANKCLFLTAVTISATTGDIAVVSNANITADHVLVECVFADPVAITTDVSWTTTSGSLTLNGTCSTATTANIVLVKKDN